MAKCALILVWVLAIAAFFVDPESTLSTIGQWVFWLMLIAHVGEALFFREKLRAAPGSMASNVVNTLIFGLLHVQSLADGGPELHTPEGR